LQDPAPCLALVRRGSEISAVAYIDLMQFDGSQCEPMTWEDWKLLVYLICIRQPHLVAVQARNMHLELRECFAALLIRSNCCADL
jgi:hypothetical protein